MNRNGRMQGWAAVLFAAVLFAGGSSEAAVQDSWITAKVKIALRTSRHVRGMPIDVDTDQGRVTLHGRVATERERREAIGVAEQVHDVREVRSLLQVVPGGHEKEVVREDRDVRREVRAILYDDPRLRGSHLHVQSVNGGVVLLGGEARDVGDELQALEDARSVHGVRRVESDIRASDRESDEQVAVESRHEDRVSDAWITAKIKMKFMADHDIPATDVHVDTHDHTVTLFGTVPSRPVAGKAESVARGVRGVSHVENELKVAGERRGG
jgi:osmotically-inducible protein OsmY